MRTLIKIKRQNDSGVKSCSKRLLSLLLVLAIVAGLLPVGALATGGLTEQGVAPESGLYTAPGGEQYTVLYTDHIAVYVSNLDGGFAILPAGEDFDGTQPLSYASFLIDGEAYRYGTYYAGASGEVGIAPEVNAFGVLESHWQIGGFVISQLFAITRDTENRDSYAVKVGYVAEYFGEGESSIGGRILLDTQFTPDETVPLLLLDSEGNALLAQTEAALSPAPVSASVSGDLIRAEGLPDAPNKGFLLFEDSNWSTPDSVVFAALESVSAYDYTPDWDRQLWGGSGADSAALLYWDEVPVASGGATSFGTNYGFYDMGRGEVDAEPINKADAPLQLLAEETQTATALVSQQEAPLEWFDLQCSLPLTLEDEYETNRSWSGTMTEGMELTVGLVFKPGTPEIIRKSAAKYNLWISWDGAEIGGANWPVNTEIAVGELYTLSGDYFKYRKDTEDLNISATPILEPADGYAYVELNLSGYYDNKYAGATAELTGEGVQRYLTSFGRKDYLVPQGNPFKLTAEVSNTDYAPQAAGDNEESYVRWERSGESIFTPLSDSAKGAFGPRAYEYEITVPSDVKSGSITLYIDQKGQSAPQRYPINVKAYDDKGRFDQITEKKLWAALSGTSIEGGLHWGADSALISVDGGFQPGAGKLYLYRAGTNKPAFGGDGAVTVGNQYAMPSEAVDLVYEPETICRVFGEVTGGGTATVVFAPSSPAKGAKDVYVYVTGIEEGYQLAANGVSATGADQAEVNLTAVPGEMWKFDMPAKGDVTVTFNLVKKPVKPMHAVTVKPLVGDGLTLYDIMFWTDSANGKRQPYEVDEAGRIGKIQEGATVHYVVYPTNWNTAEGSLGNMNEWVVDGFTINGKPVSGFEGINTGKDEHDEHKGIEYFPYDYTPNTGTAGSFVMPNELVTLELTGYKKTKLYTMTMEAYDQNGNRLTLPENAVRSGTVDYTELWNPPDTWQSGLNVPAFMEQFICMEVLKNIGDWTLDSVRLEVGGVELEEFSKVDTYSSTASNRYYFQPQYSRDAVVKVIYHAPKKHTLTVTGYEPVNLNEFRPGEVRVYESTFLLRERTLALRENNKGEFKANITLSWEPEFDNGIKYTLPASGAGFTATLLHTEHGRATYEVALTADATIAIGTGPVAPNLHLSAQPLPNTPNAKNFVSVDISSWMENLREVLTADVAPKFTRATLTTVLPEDGFPKTVTADSAIKAAITYPAKNNWGYEVDEGTVMRLDIRQLFGIAEDYVFGGGEAANGYTFTLEWDYGVNLSGKGSQSYTFTLDPNAFAPGEITYLGVVQANATKPDGQGGLIEQGNWYVVRGLDQSEMLEQAKKISTAKPLITLANDAGFFPGGEGSEYAYWAQGAVAMNGHAYFKEMPWGGGTFYLVEENGSVTVRTKSMSLGSKNIPVWLPIQAGGGGGAWQAGSDTLSFTLEQGKTYSIPDEIPEYHKGNSATGEQAQEAWQQEVDELLDNTVVITPGDDGVELSITIGEYEMQGLKVAVDDIYLLGHGFNVGGELLVQIPGTSDPVLSVAIVMLTTDNSAQVIPIDNVWAEGEGRVRLPDFIGGYGGSAAGVFNTYTQNFGFEGEVNLHVIELSGSFYMARSERFKLPVLDRFEVSVGADFIAAGLGIPPAPAQIIELQGVKIGATNLADTADYDPRRNTIPTVRFILGGSFQLVEVIGFEATMWAELLSGGISVQGGLEIGPVSLDLIKNAEMNLGAKDGPFEPYGDPGLFVKGKRSLVFYINATCHVSLFGIVDGAGGFSITLQVSPALWEKRGGFDNLEDLIEFISLKMKASGYVYASVNVPFTDWTIADADVTIDIQFEPGLDLDVAPFGLRKFEFIATERFLGMKVGEDRFDLVKLYPGLNKWLQEKLNREKGKSLQTLADGQDAAGATLTALNTFLADPDASGLKPDSNYKGEHRSLGFGSAVAQSDVRDESRDQLGALAIVQDTANIRVSTDGKTYTHTVTVPDDGNNYGLQLEGYGGTAVSAADFSVIKPNGQALTLRELTGTVSAEQAATGYNIGIVDGVLTLSLSDFLNTTTVDGNPTVEAGFDTLHGEWQITSAKQFKSSLIPFSAAPGVKSVELKDNKVTAVFENLEANATYYYDVVLERRDASDTAPLETHSLVRAAQLSGDGPVEVNLTGLSIEGRQDSYELDEILNSGSWYPRVTLLSGEANNYTLGSETRSMVVTEYIDDKVGATPHKITNTALDGISWDPKLEVLPGGNQSIDISWDAATVPDGSGMAVRGYQITVYDANGMPASRTVTAADGSQTVELLEFTLYTSSETHYSYNLPNIPTGDGYTVGVVALYADILDSGVDVLDAETKQPQLSAVVRRGDQKKATTDITIAATQPPTLSLRVAGGGNLVTESGMKFAFVGADATLIAETSDGATVSFTEYDGTSVLFGENNPLVSYAGKTLVVTATNAQMDSVSEFVQIVASTEAPLLLPDAYSEAEQTFVFTAYKDTGRYTVTGQTDPGASIGNTTAGEDGRFSFTGNLESGVDSQILTLSVANAAGMLTMREVKILRGTQNQPKAPSGGSSSAGGGASLSTSTETYQSGGGKDLVVTLTPGGYALKAIKNGDTALVQNVDYTVSGNTVTIKAAYLDSLAPGQHKLTFDMSGGVDPVLTLTVEEGDALGSWESPFGDIDETDWFYSDVQFVCQRGLFNGTGDGAFSPHLPMTRGMLVTVLWRLAGQPEPGGSTSFTDLEQDWYEKAVAWAAQSGIVTGYSAEQFGPNDNISRQDVAVILARYMEQAGINIPVTEEYRLFADEDEIAGYAKNAVQLMNKLGIINGVGENTINPTENATRAEIAAMVHRFLQRVES